VDVDLFVECPLDAIAALLTAHGYELDAGRREFTKNGVPVHLVTPEQAGAILGETVVVDEVITVTLAALIEMKPRSGFRNVLRAQDLADVIGLIGVHNLTGALPATWIALSGRSFRTSFEPWSSRRSDANWLISTEHSPWPELQYRKWR